MKRQNEREGALEAKPCDWQALKGGRAFPLCGSGHKERHWIILSKPASTLTFSKRAMGSKKKLPETIPRYEIKPIFSLKIQPFRKKKKVLGTGALQGISGN